MLASLSEQSADDPGEALASEEVLAIDTNTEATGRHSLQTRAEDEDGPVLESASQESFKLRTALIARVLAKKCTPIFLIGKP